MPATPTSNRSGLARIAPFALAALVSAWLASTGALAGGSLAVAFLALLFAALGLAVHRRRPAATRVALLIGIAGTVMVILLCGALLVEASHGRDQGIAIAVAAVAGLLGVLPVTMTIASVSALRGLPSSPSAWLAAVALLAGAAALLVALLLFGARLVAPFALDGVEVHELRFSAGGSELTAASEFAQRANVFSMADGRFVRAEPENGMRHPRHGAGPYRSDDGAMALEIGRSGTRVDALTVRDAVGNVLWHRRLGLADTLARGNACCLVGAAAFSPDDRYLAVAYFGTVYLYEARTGVEVAVMDGPTRERLPSPSWWKSLRRVF